MNAGMHSGQDALEQIVSEFERLVKSMAQQAGSMRDAGDVQSLEQQVRQQGQALLGRLVQRLLQQAVDQQQEPSRTCPDCGGRRRHQGVRPRRLRTSLGEARVRGIYWRCPDCGRCGHSAERLMPDSLSGLLSRLTVLMGAALVSFHKAELVVEQVLNVQLDDETIRRRCLAEGGQASRDADQPPAPVGEDDTLIGSCDGTMVRTRQTGWREVKGFRFEHEAGRFGGAALENAEQFAPRLKRAADRLGHERAGRCVFLSDMAQWIGHAVTEQLPTWQHVADYWHACEHLHAAGEAIYGRYEPRGRKWSVYWSRRLKRYGGAVVAERMRRTVLCYRELPRQSRLLEMIRFLEKHASRMDYPRYEQEGLPIGSGPMESFCKQLGRRMKGPGMFWSVHNVTPMAMLVSRWTLEPERFATLHDKRNAA